MYSKLVLLFMYSNLVPSLMYPACNFVGMYRFLFIYNKLGCLHYGVISSMVDLIRMFYL